MYKIVPLIIVWLLISGISHSQFLTYSETYVNGQTYCPGDPVYDNWISFRAQLDTNNIEFISVTISGDQDPIGKTCTDLAMVKQMAGSLKDGVAGTWVCGAETFAVGVGCSAGGCALVADAIEFNANGTVCSCDNPGYILRPARGNSNWGGINGPTCGGVTQIMTVTFEFICTPPYTNPCSSGDYIDGVQFSNINNVGTGCNGNSNNFIFYSSPPALVGRGVSYPITLTPSTTNPIGFGVWIDLNSDNDYSDTGEFVLSVAPGIIPVNDTITIPIWALIGDTRIRIRAIAGTTPTAVDSCSNATDGETEDYALEIRLLTDIGILQIESPVTLCGLTATEAIVVSVYNFGAVDQDSIPLAYRVDGGAPILDTLYSTLAAGDTVSFTFSSTYDFSAPGTFVLDAWSNVTADSDSTNDSSLANVVVHIPIISSYPYFQNFESGDGGWDSEGDNDSWEFGTPTNTYITGAGSGSNAWVTNLTGFYNSDERSFLVSPCFDFSGMSVDPRLSFSHIFSLPTFSDSGYVEFSANGGATWLKIGTATSGGLNWYNQPSGDYWDDNSGLSGVWRTARHELTSLAGQSSVVFRFVMSTNAFTQDEGFGIDDVFIWEPQPEDVGVIILDNPKTGCDLSPNVLVSIRVENFGTTSQDTIPVAYRIDGGTVVRDTIYQNTAPGDTAIFSFAVSVDMSVSAVYNVDVWTELPGDIIVFNDSLMGTTVEHLVSSAIFPFNYDIESEPLCGTFCGAVCPLIGQWTNIVTDDIDWTTDEGGTPSGGTGPTVDYTTGTSTGNYLYTEASGCSQMEAILMSPCLDIGSIATPTLIFFYHMFGTSMGELYVDIDTSGTWTTIFTAIGQQQADQLDPWLEAEIDLTVYSGIIRLRIRGITGSGFSSDIGIDDIRVYDKPPNDVGVISIDSPLECGTLSGSELVTITVRNFGFNAQDTIPVAYRVNGGPVNIDTLFTNLMPGSTASFTFANTEDLSIPGAYTFDAWTAMIPDDDANNDSLLGYIASNQLICCIPVFNALCSSNDYIDGVSFAGISNSGTGCNGNPDNYIYYANDTAKVTLGNSYPIGLIPSTLRNQGFGVWIDYNRDGDFDDANEFVFSAAQGTTPVMGSITISGLTVLGNTAMRVRCIYNTTPIAANSCDTQTFGETEDYNIFISPISPVDAGVLDVTSPTSGCALSATEIVTIVIRNFGSDTIFGLDAYYSVDGGTPVMESIPDTISPSTSFIYSFTQTVDFSAQVTYVIDAWCALIGDTVSFNDTTYNNQITSLASVITYPLLHDFESSSLCNTAPCGVSCNITGSWSNDNSGDDDMDWTIDEDGTPSTGTGPTIDVTFGSGIGNYIYTEASGCNGLTANLESSCLDLSSLTYPYLEFWYHMFGGNMGNMFVDVFESGTWTTIDAIMGEQQTVQTDPWILRSVDLSAYTGSVIKLRIRAVTGIGFTSDIAVDEILVYDKPPNDVGVISIDTPVDGCLGSGDSITVRIKNFGAVQQDTIPVVYSLNGGAPVVETVYAILNPGDTLVYTFSTPGDFSAPGAHAIDAWTEMTSDSKLANDSTLQDTVNNLSTVADFTVDNVMNCVGGLCTFSDISSNSPFDWYWTFGDGDTSILPGPTHIYAGVGMYTVTLTVINPCNTNMITKVAYMNIAEGPKLPDCTPAVVDINSNIGIYKVEFNTISNNSGSLVEGYWDYSCFAFTTVQMGSKQTLTVETGPTWFENVRAWIDYNNDSIFDEVTELVFSSDNKIGTHTTQFIISGNAVVDTMLRMRIASDYTGTVPPTPCDTLMFGQAEDYGVMILSANIKPEADFTFDITDYCNGVVEFADFSAFFPTSWSWNFGDGNTGVGNSITNTYASPGTYTVTLISTNVFGSDTTMQTIFIDSVVADFFMPNDTVTQGIAFQFVNTSYGANTWFWDLGDSSTSITNDPINSYDSVGTYTIKLVATNSVTGCKDSITYQLEVIEKPPADTTGIRDLSDLKSIILAPNPTTGLLTVYYDFQVNSDVRISLFGSTGGMVKIDQVYGINKYVHTIDLSKYAKGLYFVKFDINSNLTENKSVFRKVILE